MIIVVDIGNSIVAVGGVEGSELLFTASMKADKERTGDEYAVAIREMCALNNLSAGDATGAIMCSVVPTIAYAVRQALKKITGRECLAVGAGLKTGLNILIDDPGQLGGDMVASAVAVRTLYPLPALVLDLGTATTVSVISAEGSYTGGVIMPGAMLSVSALSQNTSQLPIIGPDAPDRLIGTNTVDCMRSGLVFGHAAMLDGIVERIGQVLGCESTVVATGGMAEFIVPYCRSRMVTDRHLVLRGLGILYYKNRKK